MMWGGLKPIWKYVLTDVIILAATVFSISIFQISSNTCALEDCCLDGFCLSLPIFGFVYIHNEYFDELIMFMVACFTLYIYGTTHRWPLTIILHTPILLFMMIGNITHSYASQEGLSRNIQKFSFGLVTFSAILLILFPTVQLAQVEGKYYGKDKSGKIGMVDIFLPVTLEGKEEETVLEPKYLIEEINGVKTTNVTVRLFYPADNSSQQHGVSYISKKLCDTLIQTMNPKPLSHFGMLIHSWCLTKLPVSRNAKPRDMLSCGRKMNLAFYSHGLFGNSTFYSYQAISLAAEGHLVMMVEHRDGSQVSTPTKNGDVCYHDFLPSKLYREGKLIEELKLRREQTKFRAIETIAALRSLIKLNEENVQALGDLGLSFIGRINVSTGALACGHSFGGATALSVAARAANLCKAVVAHEPATNWMCDLSRHALLSHDLTYSGGNIFGYDPNFDHLSFKNDEKRFRNIDILFLFSDEWKAKGWGECDRLFNMNNKGLIGSNRRLSKVLFIPNANHSAFSDCCMLTPLWLARPMQLTRLGCPYRSAYDIRNLTTSFVDSLVGHDKCARKFCG